MLQTQRKLMASVASDIYKVNFSGIKQTSGNQNQADYLMDLTVPNLKISVAYFRDVQPHYIW